MIYYHAFLALAPFVFPFSLFFSLFSCHFLIYIFPHQSVVIGFVTQHLKRALRTVVMISVSALSSILTTSENGGLTSGLASQQRVIISPRTGKQSLGMIGRAPLLTTANAACTAVMFWKGSNPVTSSQRTIPKLYTSTFWVYGLCWIISLQRQNNYCTPVATLKKLTQRYQRNIHLVYKSTYFTFSQ